MIKYSPPKISCCERPTDAYATHLDPKIPAVSTPVSAVVESKPSDSEGEPSYNLHTSNNDIFEVNNGFVVCNIFSLIIKIDHNKHKSSKMEHHKSPSCRLYSFLRSVIYICQNTIVKGTPISEVF